VFHLAGVFFPFQCICCADREKKPDPLTTVLDSLETKRHGKVALPLLVAMSTALSACPVNSTQCGFHTLASLILLVAESKPADLRRLQPGGFDLVGDRAELVLSNSALSN
jgi:hypothetical protein